MTILNLGPILNLGVVAHVDAGKTSLTERLLFAGGVIDTVGSVDAGSTRTDSLALERRRGITIKAAVASFPVGGLTVNLIDTPGHPDFIAEVERALRVLDGAILVISAVEGVQAQTRILMRTLRRLRVPTLVFVNKIDRRGAREDGVLREITSRLAPEAVAVSTVRDLGTPAASAWPSDAGLAERIVDVSGDEGLLDAYVRGDVEPGRWRSALAGLARGGRAYPVFFGSAVTGAGIDALLAGLAELLPTASGDPDGPLSGTVFKVDRGPDGGRRAYVRIFDGTLRVRDHLPDGSVVTGIDQRAELRAGEIGLVHGLRDARIGDRIGAPPDGRAGALSDRRAGAPPDGRAGAPPDGRGAGGAQDGPLFAPPTLQAVVVPVNERDRGALHAALAEMAEQDPLINLRADLTVSLYGEVQKEVIGATLAEDHGIEAEFAGTRVILVERPAGTGEAALAIGDAGNPYIATIELVVEPGNGNTFRLDVPIEQVPIHVYRTREFFAAALREAVHAYLDGRGVIDARVTVIRTGFVSPLSTAGEFRKLLPIVLERALEAAGTVTCEPVLRFDLECPADVLGAVLGALGKFGAVPEGHEVPEGQETRGDGYGIRGVIPAAAMPGLEAVIPGLTRGEGVLESGFGGYRAMGKRQIPDNGR